MIALRQPHLGSVLWIFLATPLVAQEWVISEFMAINDNTFADEAGEFDDWVEIHHLGTEESDLGGLYLSDDPEDSALWQIPEGTLVSAGGRIVIWLDDDLEQGDGHAPFRLGGAGGDLILTDRDGETQLDRITYPVQHPDIAFGRSTLDAETPIYLLKPTPGEANDPAGISALGGITYSRPAGAFHEAFELTLSTITEDGVIRYSTNGKPPSIFNGSTYSSPITITESVCLRVQVSVRGQVVSPLETQIYLAVDEAVWDFSSNLPVALIDSRGHDFSNDTSLSMGFPQSPVCSAFFEQSESGRTMLVEMPPFIGRAGMNVRGASSRGWPKKQFKFETWGEAGEDREVPLLGLPADADWILAAPYFDRSLMRNEITFRWWEKLGYYSPRTKFLEVFIDMNNDQRFTMDDYQGVYVLTEKIKSSADRLDINEESYIVEATNVNQHWTSQRGIRLKYVEPRENEEAPQRKQAIREHYDRVEREVLGDDFQDPESGYRQVLDVPSHIDYDIMREMSRNIDGASTFLSLNDAGKVQMGPLWDYNQSFGLTRLFDPVPGWRTDGWNDSYMTNAGHWMKWWDHLKTDTEYQVQWEDRWVALREGLFTNEALLGDIDAIATLLEESAERNFERWDTLGQAVWVTGGSTRADPGEGDRDTYAKEVEFVREWLTERLVWIDSQVPSPPSFTQDGGAVPSGFVLEMTRGENFGGFVGNVYFTIDGSDPRVRGGGTSATATIYEDPVMLEEDVVITARVRSLFGQWSALRRASFLVGTEAPSPSNLIMSEVHYNPRGRDTLEFLELYNRGSNPINLTGIRLEGAVRFTFPTRSLAANETVLVVEDHQAFLNHYQIDEKLIAGQWQGALSNGGEEILVVSNEENNLLTFTYGDDPSWPQGADGQGRSLELISIDSEDLNQASAWRASVAMGGSPGELPASVPTQSYAEWATTWGAADLSDPLADLDDDGMANLIEFALMTSPIDSNEATVLTVLDLEEAGRTFVGVRYPKPQISEGNHWIEASDNLTNWSRVDPIQTTETETEVTVRLQPSPSHRYIRLAVSL